MNKSKHANKIILLIGAVFLGFPSLKAQDTLKINLEQVLEIALTESPTVQVADKEIIKKKYAKRETLSGLFPSISASAGYSRTLKKQVMYMGGGDSGGGISDMITQPLTQLVKPLYEHAGIPFPELNTSTESSGDGGMEVGLDNNWNGGFSLNLPIFAPSLYKSIQLNQLDVESALESARASRVDLINQVSKAYYQLLLAQDSYDVLLKSYEQAQANYEVVENKFKQGLVSEYDKIRAQVQVYNLRPGVMQAKNAVNLTKLQLKVLMGVDSVLEFQIVGSLKDYEGQMYADLLQVDTASLANNSDLRLLEIQDQMLKKTLKLNRTAYMPTLSLSANYTWSAMNNDFRFRQYKWNPYSTIGVTLSIPIFQGGKIWSQVKQTKIQMDQLALNRINLERNLNTQLESYLDNMNTSVEQLSTNKEGVRQADKGRLIAQKRYEVGAGTILELNDSEVAYTQAELAYNQSIYDFLTAKADLDKVLGNRWTAR